MKKKVPDKRKEPIKRGKIKGSSCGPRIILIIFVFLETLLACSDLL